MVVYRWARLFPVIRDGRPRSGLFTPISCSPEKLMRPMFTVHVGEYLVGEHIERTHPRWSEWVPSKDTGIDLLVSDPKNRKMVLLQVKFSKDFNPTHSSPLMQGRLLATGWWTHDPRRIRESPANLWVFALPAFVEKQTSFVILPPAELLWRFTAIHGKGSKRIHWYFRVTKSNRCWETRGLAKADEELVTLDRFECGDRDFTMYLNHGKQLEGALV
jgi:hypothetical protein